MVTFSTEAYKPELMLMWKSCFDDSDEFIRFYFEKVYHDDNTLVLLDKNKFPVASLQILPYQVKIGNKTCDAGYISGAMTHPEHRKKGYMQQLLLAAFEVMEKDGLSFSFLIPEDNWLFDFYSKYGYEKAFPSKTQSIDLATVDVESKDVDIYNNFENLPLDEIYHLYSGFLLQKENVVLKTKEQFRFILEDLFLDKGNIFYLEGKGIAFAMREGKKVYIKEALYITDDFKQLLLSAIKSIYQTDKMVLYSNNPEDKYSRYYGMIKIFNRTDFSEPIPKKLYLSMMQG